MIPVRRTCQTLVIVKRFKHILSYYSFPDGKNTASLPKVIKIQLHREFNSNTGRARLIRSHSSARFCCELSGNSN